MSLSANGNALEETEIDLQRLPSHIAIIMDGNGRWAKKRNLPRSLGHRQGMVAIEEITEACCELKIPTLSLFAFSTENWKRPVKEVSFLMKLLEEFIYSKIEKLRQQNVRLFFTGDLSALPEFAKKAVDTALEKTCNCNGLNLNIALNYGARWEIAEAAKKIAVDVAGGRLCPEDITTDTFASYLLTYRWPDPDLLIRTSGECRISNFLLWQLAYCELYFTDTLWPDFGKNELKEAIINYQYRQRRFGA